MPELVVSPPKTAPEIPSLDGPTEDSGGSPKTDIEPSILTEHDGTGARESIATSASKTWSWTCDDARADD